MILTGKTHNPPGSVAPWLLPGGLEALRAPRGPSPSIIGVGGPDVPLAVLTQLDAATNDVPSNGGRGLLDAVSASVTLCCAWNVKYKVSVAFIHCFEQDISLVDMSVSYSIIRNECMF